MSEDQRQTAAQSCAPGEGGGRSSRGGPFCTFVLLPATQETRVQSQGQEDPLDSPPPRFAPSKPPEGCGDSAGSPAEARGRGAAELNLSPTCFNSPGVATVFDFSAFGRARSTCPASLRGWPSSGGERPGRPNPEAGVAGTGRGLAGFTRPPGALGPRFQGCSFGPTPRSSVSKESSCNAGDPGLIPGFGRSPGAGNDREEA